MDASNAYFSDAGAPDQLPPEEPKEEQASTKTALLPISFFKGKSLNPGDTCEVKIDQVMDDQVSVSYVGSDTEEEGEGMAEDEGTETTQASTPPASIPGPNMFE